ncbi:MAG: hypothetical protein HYS09_09610 [Chloroflexi bacterium]|nr:hypothetical protein [Chloroflexota bacterium]
MLFLIAQEHTPELCPKGNGGSKSLYDEKAEGVKVRGVYGAFSEHLIYYIVEANGLGAVHKFLDPGWTRCTATITPVSEEAIP